jgi:hypothetical protein
MLLGITSTVSIPSSFSKIARSRSDVANSRSSFGSSAPESVWRAPLKDRVDSPQVAGTWRRHGRRNTSNSTLCVSETMGVLAGNGKARRKTDDRITASKGRDKAALEAPSQGLLQGRQKVAFPQQSKAHLLCVPPGRLVRGRGKMEFRCSN